ncbi:hypothetical protein ISS21_01665 [Patescibacteria group bacterium]|nr:hypothetical protein [Patescibacteria group bacterium]
MANINRNKIIKLYVLRPYGHGAEEYKGEKMVKYVDYFLEDLATMIIEQDKEKDLNKNIAGKKKKRRRLKIEGAEATGIPIPGDTL